VLENINKRLRLPRPLTGSDIIAERCGVRPLVVSGSGNGGRELDAALAQACRRHRRPRGRITVFGGKLSDCLNVGEEICAEVRRLASTSRSRSGPGMRAPQAGPRGVLHQARLMDLDALTTPQASEKLSSRLWRRYGAEALGLLEAIRRDPRQAEVIIETSEYIRCELTKQPGARWW